MSLSLSFSFSALFLVLLIPGFHKFLICISHQDGGRDGAWSQHMQNTNKPRLARGSQRLRPRFVCHGDLCRQEEAEEEGRG